MIETFIYLALFALGLITGWSQSLIHQPRRTHVHVAEMSSEEAHEIVNAYLRSRANHPSNQRFRHPEMEEEDDC